MTTTGRPPPSRRPAESRSRVGKEGSREEGFREEKARLLPAPPARPDLRIVQTQVFRGPNYFSYDPAIRLVVDLGSLEQWPSNTLPGFTETLLELLPGVGEHSCSRGHAGGFRERLEEGTWAGHVAEHVAIELQRESGAQVYRGKTRSTGRPGEYNVTYGYWEEQVGLAAGTLAVRLVNHLVKRERGFEFTEELERLILLAERRAFGPSTQALVDEAEARDIPFIRLNDQSFVQLGQGKYQQRIRATMTSLTSALAVDVAGDKQLTRQLLESAGLPVPMGRVVRTVDQRRRGRQACRVPGRGEAARRQPRAGRRARSHDRARRSRGVLASAQAEPGRARGGRGHGDRSRLPHSS